MAASAAPALAQPSSCSEFGGRAVQSGEVLDCSLNVIGGSLVVERGGEVTGSVNVPFGDATIHGVVGGDVYAGGDIAVDGNVRGTVFATGDVTVSGTAEGDVTANGNIEISGRAAGNVESFGGDAAIAGAVDGDVRATGDVDLAASAVVAGSVQPGGDVVRAAGAQILNQATDAVQAPTRPGWARTMIRMLLALSMIVFAALFGALLTAVAPGAVRNLRRTAGEAPGMSAAAGIGAALVAAPLVAMLLIPGLVMPALWGIMAPLIAIVAAVYIAAVCVGAVGAGNLIGSKLLGGRSETAQSAAGAALLALVAALGVFFGIRAWPQLCFTAGIALIVKSWLSGASWLTLFGRRPWPPSDAPAPMTPGTSEIAEPGSVATGPFDSSPSGAGASELQAPDSDSPTPPSEPPAQPSEPPSEPFSKPPATPPSSAPDHNADPAIPAGPRAGADAAIAMAELRRVPGITPIYARLLLEAGIGGLADLAAAMPETIVQAASVPGVMGIEHAAAGQWIEQAKNLVDRSV